MASFPFHHFSLNSVERSTYVAKPGCLTAVVLIPFYGYTYARVQPLRESVTMPIWGLPEVFCFTRVVGNLIFDALLFPFSVFFLFRLSFFVCFSYALALGDSSVAYLNLLGTKILCCCC
jgi:hypothetical protein